jgi:uncharacterized membrane protein YebE (DUF533 family)
MNRTFLVAVALAAPLFGLASTAQADVTDTRQARQAHRIEQGVRSGSLTRSEAAKLAAEQERIRALERNAKRDGYVDPAERRRLQAAQNSASRNIRAEKHDYEDRGPRRRWWGHYGWRGDRHGYGYGYGPRRWW